MGEYRVVIEERNDKGQLQQRVELRDAAVDENWRDNALGILVAGAIAGMCVYDEPMAFCVAASLLDALDFPKDANPLNAIGYAADYWWRHDSAQPKFDEVCKVVVRSDWCPNPTWATAIPKDQWDSLGQEEPLTQART